MPATLTQMVNVRTESHAQNVAEKTITVSSVSVALIDPTIQTEETIEEGSEAALGELIEEIRGGAKEDPTEVHMAEVNLSAPQDHRD